MEVTDKSTPHVRTHTNTMPNSQCCVNSVYILQDHVQELNSFHDDNVIAKQFFLRFTKWLITSLFEETEVFSPAL